MVNWVDTPSNGSGEGDEILDCKIFFFGMEVI